ncbi:MAG TPA: tol-pal system-associated acyl-CoA thioesterase [Gammaproteobacteria bacterium]|nr:tol-pal system-associated acyl-CoA thioesterase [Gammaproteobacteria bacterium]
MTIDDKGFFITQARVYYEDTDAGGVVFYANYLKYMERARTEWLRRLGVEQRALAEEQDALFAVVNVNVNYRRPARLDDLLEIGARVVERGRTSLVFEQFVRRAADGEILADGRVKAACLAAGSFRPRAIPAFILERLQS